MRRALVAPKSSQCSIAFGNSLLHGGDVGVDQVVVALVADPGVPLAQVHLVVEQPEVVGAHVQHHRQHPAGVDAGGRGVDGELADGDLDAADALVADAEDALGVGGDQQVDVVGAETGVPQRGLDLLGVVDRQVHAAGAAELVAEPLDRQPDGGGVDDGQHLGDVLGQQPVEQHLVAVPQVRQVHPLAQVVGLLAVLGVDPPQLAVQRGDPGRAADPVSPSVSRSARVNAVPRLMVGVASTAEPRAWIRAM